MVPLPVAPLAQPCERFKTPSCLRGNVRSGEVLQDECVYFAQLSSKSHAIRHTGDEVDGDADLGQGDDEIIVVSLPRVPPSVCALYFIATVATEGRTFADCKSSRIRLVNWTSGAEICRYVPAMAGAHTARQHTRSKLGACASRAPPCRR